MSETPVQFGDFSTIPVLDYSLVTNDGGVNKGKFVDELRHALVNVGFLYLSNAPVDKVRANIADSPALPVLLLIGPPPILSCRR
jgi:hypothetical protein